ncbi:hypothetical protein PPL_08599 [Heterostelium album PN500]|uniref:Uncharacterized protein n=1 Tax=Heterostelium pallidum (strain ATCC 26659 / Pp 5 / PN500) TaxID=670386 RepID=D3BJ74_HETP5|nr:hypothetical protein PPL_08599 [Heterostelium album PN500]EFA77954.1 hypothetical protein PPL_08599 [Heterostelium album PN500]|eukprot:XP_020430082.1 hypothetical protein PPL_08599 [Heterostelium album PN500]
MSVQIINEIINKEEIEKAPVMPLVDLQDVPELDSEEKHKNKEFQPFAQTDKLKVKKQQSPKNRKKKARLIEKAINRKEKVEIVVEKKLKKALVKKRWNALY